MSYQRVLSNDDLLLSYDDDGQDDDVYGDTTTISSRTSLFSTNYTMSNLVGAGRVLGNFYSFAGRRLERTVGTIAHRAGFGPSATFEKIRQMYYTSWRGEKDKGEYYLVCLGAPTLMPTFLPM